METTCKDYHFDFQGNGQRKVHADFDGGQVGSDGGALLLRELDKRLNITARLAQCFTDHRDPERIEHSLLSLLRQRIYGIALGYEDLNDHNDLMRDFLFALCIDKEDVEGEQRQRPCDKGKSLASASTLNRLELTPDDATASARYKKIVYDADKLESLFIELFLELHSSCSNPLILDFDATDDPIHGEQEGRFFNGYYDCYCYLPLYVTCEDYLLVSKLRESNVDASSGTLEVLSKLVTQIRERWPDREIIMRADSGFCRDHIMKWCESNQVYYLLGLAKNPRLLRHIVRQQDNAHIRHLMTGAPARVFTEFTYQTEKSWSCARRVIAKAEQLRGGANPRFIVTNLPETYGTAQNLYEELYCARGDMENRIKEQQLDLFADRTSAHTKRANQLRLWFSSLAYLLVSALRRIGLKSTTMAKATSGTIRLKLFKIGAIVKVSVRRFYISMVSACPYKEVFAQALRNIMAYPLRT